MKLDILPVVTQFFCMLVFFNTWTSSDRVPEQHWHPCVCVVCQIRRALLQLLFPGKPFHWLRHTTIALCLLFAVNLLVILVPNIRDIFGITGEISD